MSKLLKNLKLLLATFVGVFVIGLPIASPILAVDVLDPACDAAPSSTLCKSKKSQTPGSNSVYGKGSVLAKITSLIALVTGVAAVIMIIIGGLRYVLANGDPQSINGAKDTILYSLIGLVIAATAQGIVVFVFNRL